MRRMRKLKRLDIECMAESSGPVVVKQFNYGNELREFLITTSKLNELIAFHRQLLSLDVAENVDPKKRCTALRKSKLKRLHNVSINLHLPYRQLSAGAGSAESWQFEPATRRDKSGETLEGTSSGIRQMAVFAFPWSTFPWKILPKICLLLNNLLLTSFRILLAREESGWTDRGAIFARLSS